MLLATGTCDNIPNIPGFAEFWGRGIYHCPFCDGWEYRHKRIGLYSAINCYGMALELRKLSKNLTIFTDSRKYFSPRQRLVISAAGIKINAEKVHEVKKDDAEILHLSSGANSISDLDVLFVNNGNTVNRELLLQLNCKCALVGGAITNKKQQTNVCGLYVAGDSSLDMQFVVVAAAEGAKAGVAIHNDLLEVDNAI
ncbi:MAG: NAD(P)/FAD-dependent oxidoreductase [Taibaiella sp.]|nr:NAD(P)/FAD-dependent oxidoreductase [Taibaiella sp.]